MSGTIPTTMWLQRFAERGPAQGCIFAACGRAPETVCTGRSALFVMGRTSCIRNAIEPVLLQAKAPP